MRTPALSTNSQTASEAACSHILDKIDFLLKVQEIADGVDQVEPLFEDLVDRIKEKEPCGSQVLQRFCALLPRINPWSLEILQFCMHDLRWLEIRDEAEHLLNNEKLPGKRRLYERLIESFNDDWPEREFFRRYSE